MQLQLPPFAMGLGLYLLGGQCSNKASMNTVLSVQYYLNICSEKSTTNMQ